MAVCVAGHVQGDEDLLAGRSGQPGNTSNTCWHFKCRVAHGQETSDQALGT